MPEVSKSFKAFFFWERWRLAGPLPCNGLIHSPAGPVLRSPAMRDGGWTFSGAIKGVEILEGHFVPPAARGRGHRSAMSLPSNQDIAESQSGLRTVCSCANLGA